jgi:hypothetical protein
MNLDDEIRRGERQRATLEPGSDRFLHGWRGADWRRRGDYWRRGHGIGRNHRPQQ